MAGYVIRRLIQCVVIIFLVTLGLFFAMRLLPGDPLLMIINQEQLGELTQERLDQLREEHGFNRPLIVQYFSWISDTVHGDLGTSITYTSPVTSLLKKRIPITFHLGILSFIIAHVIGIAIGIFSAIRRGTRLDTGLTVLANIGITIPTFWLGIMLIYLFALYWHLLPPMGYTSPFENFWLSTRQLIMPVFCLAVLPLASAARQTRSSVLEIMRQDYVRTAWSKGLKERSVVMRHALKNATYPGDYPGRAWCCQYHRRLGTG